MIGISLENGSQRRDPETAGCLRKIHIISVKPILFHLPRTCSYFDIYISNDINFLKKIAMFLKHCVLFGGWGQENFCD